MHAIDPRLLAHVVGGRKTPQPGQVDPKIYQGMAQIAQAVKGAGDEIAQAKVADGQQSMQMIGQMMQDKMAGGGGRRA